MTTIPSSRMTRLLLGCLAASALVVAAGVWPFKSAAQPPAVPGRPDRPDDEAAVRKSLDGFAAAFRKGDAKSLAGYWTTNAEYTSEQGVSIRGRAALEKAYAETFAESPENGLDVEVEDVRFPSGETAVIDGHFKLRRKGETVVSRCSFLFTREDGAWRVAVAREWPGDGLSLRDLDWLIGSWEAKRDGAAVTATYEWVPGKAFIRTRFTVAGGPTEGGTQMIGYDPATGALQAWTFEDAGGVGESGITRDEKKWVFTARGTTAEGRAVTATNILTPVDADSFLWLTVGRTAEDEPLPDLPPVKVTRVPTKP